MEMIVKKILTVLAISFFIETGFVQGLNKYNSNEEKCDSIFDTNKESFMKSDWWPMYQHDLCNSGYSMSSSPDTNAVLWTFQSYGNVHSPSVANGKIYFGTNGTGNPVNAESFLYCVDLQGSEIWKYKTFEALDSQPAITNNRVYIGGEQGTIYCLDSNTGKCIWIVSTKDEKASSPKVFDNKIFFGTLNGNLYCLHADSGEIIWRKTIGIDIKSTPAIVNNKIYISNYCIEASTGNIVWTSEIHVPFLSSPTISNNSIYMGSIDEFFYAFNAENGTPTWDHYIGSMVWELSPSSAYGDIYVGNAFGYLYCLDSTTGDEKWVIKKSTRSITSPAISDGKIYIGSTDGNVYCFNALSGATIWNYHSNEPFDCSPALADGKVFIGSGDVLYCFGEDQRLGSDLDCGGTVAWSNVQPNSHVTSNLTIANIGKSNSSLDWNIESYPEWGNWTFSPICGYDLEPNDGVVTVWITVVVPNVKKGSFDGIIKIVNSYNDSDYEILDISMTTSYDKNKDISFFQNIQKLYLYLKTKYFF